jgi:hypothetical protein
MLSTVEVPEEQMAVEEGNNLASEEGNNLAFRELKKEGLGIRHQLRGQEAIPLI